MTTQDCFFHVHCFVFTYNEQHLTFYCKSTECHKAFLPVFVSPISPPPTYLKYFASLAKVLSNCLPSVFYLKLFINIPAITDLITFADSYKNLQEIYET